MANRYVDTGFFKSPFIRGLKGSLKGLYSYIICDCTGAGIWAKDLPVASVYVGFEILESDFEIFVKSGKAIDLKDGKFFFPDFIEHQYPKGLSKTNPAHTNFILELEKYGLIDKNLKVLTSPLEGTNVIVKVKEDVKVKDRKVQEGKDPTEEKISPLQTDYTEYPDYVLKAWPTFEKILIDDCPRVQKLSKPITIKEYSEHFELYESEAGRQVLLAMENRKNLLTSYTNANLTFLAWIKKDFNGTNKLNIPNGNKSKNAACLAATDGLGNSRSRSSV